LQTLDLFIFQFGLDKLKKGKYGAEFKIDNPTLASTPKKDTIRRDRKTHHPFRKAVRLQKGVQSGIVEGCNVTSKRFVRLIHNLSQSKDDAALVRTK